MWEYRRIVDPLLDEQHDPLPELLELGAQGWELVAVVPAPMNRAGSTTLNFQQTFWLKRAVSAPAAARG